MKKIFFLILVIALNLFAQELDTSWINSYSGLDSLGSRPVKQLVDQFNNIVITGVEYTSSGRDDIVIIKYDAYGNLLWSDLYDGPAHKMDVPTHLLIDNYGYIYVAGESRGKNGFSECNGVVILKYHPTGELAWVKRYDEQVGSYVYVRGLAVDAERNLILTTELVEGLTLTMIELVSRKFYPTGDLVWEANLPLQKWSLCYGINTDDFGNIFMGGWLWQGIGNPDYEFFGLIKYNKYGTLQWFSSFRDSAASDAWCEVFCKDNQCNFYAAGVTEKITGKDVFATVKYDKDGNFIWYQEFSAGYNPEVFDLTTDNFDNVIWIAEDRDDSTYELATVISKYLSNGDSDWIRYLLMDSDEPLLIRTDEEDNIYTLIRIWNGFYSPTIIKLDPLGNTIWTWSYEEEEFYPVDIAINNDKSIIVTGSLKINGNDNIRTVKLSQSGISHVYPISESLAEKVFTLKQNYPNPFNPVTIIGWQSPISGFQSIKVFDVLGNEIITLVSEYRAAGKYEVEYDASLLPSGVYFYQLRAGGNTAVKKMLLIK